MANFIFKRQNENWSDRSDKWLGYRAVMNDHLFIRHEILRSPWIFIGRESEPRQLRCGCHRIIARDCSIKVHIWFGRGAFVSFITNKRDETIHYLHNAIAAMVDPEEWIAVPKVSTYLDNGTGLCHPTSYHPDYNVARSFLSAWINKDINVPYMCV